jgi:hypothetical protein
VAGSLVGLTGCDLAKTTTSASTDAPPLDSVATAALQGFTLTEAQRQQIRTDAGDRSAPGFRWRQADRFQAVLTDDQKETLFERWRARRSDGRKRPARMKRMVQRLRRAADRLALTAAQRREVRRAVQSARESWQALLRQRAQEGVALDAVAELRADTKERLRAVLTDEQRAAWRTHRADRRARREAVRAVRRDVLAVSATQRSALKAHRADRQEAVRTARADFWSGRIDRKEQGQRLREARRAFRTQAARVLRTEQVETLRLHRILVAHAAQQRRSESAGS